MIALVSAGAGFVVYMVLLSVMGYVHGEAPGRLRRYLAHLRGEPATRRKPLFWAESGHLTRQQRTSLTAVAVAVLGGGGYLLLRSWPLAILASFLAPLYPWLLERTFRLKRRELLNVQFGMALQAMSASLRAGASLRTAIERAGPDLERMLTGQPLTPMVTELELVNRDLQMGLSVEEALARLRDRVQMEDVTDFVGAVLLCRVRGGNAAAVMASIAGIIEDKISVRQQIHTLTAGKRAEGNMIIFAPPVLVGFLAVTSPSYLAPLYERLIGQVMLAVGAACLVSAYLIGRRLLEIEV